jgi:REP element-mobilizing transposase RayT
MARGNRKSKIFIDDCDRLEFLELLSAAKERFNVRWQQFDLMNTHYHLKVETPEGNISKAMQFVNKTFTQAWNRRHRTTGHVFEGRFKSPLVEDGWHGRNVISYIALNPVKAKYVQHAAEWPWSSHRALAGLASPPEFLDLDWLRRYFEGPSLRDCQRQYQEFIDAEELRLNDFGDSFVVGSDEYRSNVRELIGASMHRLDVPRSYRALARPPLATLFAGCREDLERRNQMVIRAQVVHGYTQSEIGRALGLHPNTISKITRAIRSQRYYLVRVK